MLVRIFKIFLASCSVSFFHQIFVPHENRSQIDEVYNKTNIIKLQKLCNEVRVFPASPFLNRSLSSLFQVGSVIRPQKSTSLIGCFLRAKIGTNQKHCMDLRHLRRSREGKQSRGFVA